MIFCIDVTIPTRQEIKCLLYDVFFITFFMFKNKISWLQEKLVMALRGVRFGSMRSPSWFWEESIITLRAARQGQTGFCWCWQYPSLMESSPNYDGLLAEIWQKFLSEPWQIPLRAITKFCIKWLFLLHDKNYINIYKNLKKKIPHRTQFFFFYN